MVDVTKGTGADGDQKDNPYLELKDENKRVSDVRAKSMYPNSEASEEVKSHTALTDLKKIN